jgi:hypothetical protein
MSRVFLHIFIWLSPGVNTKTFATSVVPALLPSPPICLGSSPAESGDPETVIADQTKKIELKKRFVSGCAKCIHLFI